MTSVQIRDVPDPIVDALKQEASEQGQSLQQYLRGILEEQARIDETSAIMREAAAEAQQGGSTDFDSATLVRTSRDERGDELFARTKQ